MKFHAYPLRVGGVAFSLLAASAVFAAQPVRADDASEAILRRLDALEKENSKLRAEVKRIESKTAQKPAPAALAAPAPGQGKAVVDVAPPTGAFVPTAGSGPGYALTSGDPKWYFEKKPGDGLTFRTPGGEITAYGYFDVSFDVATKGITRTVGGFNPSDSPVGNMGWLPDLSTNLSYIGVRGFQKVPGESGLKFVYQLEAQLDIAATSGTAETGSNQSNVVKSGLTSRNTFIGFASDDWGAIKAGKTDAPYKTSTAMMNPFSGMLGDYQVIMGNTGGDNRVEFGTRLDHSIWYESPNFAGFKFAALYSPGQNRASNSDNIAAGESDCTGGNIPGSGGLAPFCNDGAFSDAFSVSATYTNGPLLLTTAYERHQRVNRSSDIDGIYASGVPAGFDAADTADEDAFKVGAQYKFATKTTVSAIWETMHRYVPSFLSFQNERQRQGTWLAVTQELTPKDSVSVGWAHAFKTPGDPGQHNDSINTPPLGVPGTDFVAGANVDNHADMVTAAYTRILGNGISAYVDWAGTFNGPFAHYDLGAGGRAVTVDCHDASSASGGAQSNPHCWTGETLMGVSVGLRYRF
jgi:predicted porin